MIEEVVVKKYGSTSGHIVLNRDMIGKKVWLVTDKESWDLKELIEKTLLFRKVDRLDRKEISEKFDSFARDVMYRLTRLENVVYGTKQKAVK